MIDITAKQLQIVNTIARLTDALGYPPGVREIAHEIGCAKSTMHYHLSALYAKGLIKWELGQQRTIRLVCQYACAHCPVGQERKHK